MDVKRNGNQAARHGTTKTIINIECGVYCNGSRVKSIATNPSLPVPRTNTTAFGVIAAAAEAVAKIGCQEFCFETNGKIKNQRFHSVEMDKW
ncbi:hypothetical protein BLOT_001129 [Blomia tropicalis]|nr:hypothetical protein BLOT_001129 [Blomia tropicalis]